MPYTLRHDVAARTNGIVQLPDLWHSIQGLSKIRYSMRLGSAALRGSKAIDGVVGLTPIG